MPNGAEGRGRETPGQTNLVSAPRDIAALLKEAQGVSRERKEQGTAMSQMEKY